MKKKFVSLLMALIMVLAISAPVTVMAYDRDNLPPVSQEQTTFTLFRAYHWVVRGQTLDQIANIWGTHVDVIRGYNQEYFTDLARRSQTLFNNPNHLQVEYGVRLKIGYMLQARHYVVRGDTLASLAGGRIVTPCGFQMFTTPDRIRQQNPNWFAQLAALNATMGTNHTLVESHNLMLSGIASSVEHDFRYVLGRPGVDHLASLASYFLGDGRTGLRGEFGGTPISEPLRAVSMSNLGTPLYITVPVTVNYTADGYLAHDNVPLTVVVFLPSHAEVVPWWTNRGDAHLQWHGPLNLNHWNYAIPSATNPYIVGVPIGITASPIGLQRHEILPLNVRGIFSTMN